MHYRQGKNRDQVFMCSLNSMITFDSWARLVDVFVDALPILEMGFNHTQLNKEGHVPYHPGDLLKLLLYGYRKGIRSANKLHEATRINVEVIFLLKGLQPSARTINYFRSNNSEAIEKAHRYFVKLLKSWKLIEGEARAVIKHRNIVEVGYNIQAVADAKYNLVVDVFAAGSMTCTN